VKRPCLDCGVPTENSRCLSCGSRFESVRNARETVLRSAGLRAHRHQYSGEYRRRAAEVRANASVCWLCGEGWRRDDPWQADHVIPGNSYSELRAAHRSCNVKRANQGRSSKNQNGR